MGTSGTALVCGAGPGGLAAAVALRRAGWRVIVCERHDRLGGVGSGLTLWPNATRALAAIDRLAPLAARSRPLQAIAMRDWHGRTLFEQALDGGGDGADFPSLALLRSDLVEGLAGPVRDTIRLRTRLVAIAPRAGGVEARFADGSAMAADLLVGADGLHSTVRTFVHGAEPPLFAGYTVWRGIAGAVFEPEVGVTFMGRARQFGMFPLQGERTYWFAAAVAPPAADGLRAEELASLAATAPMPIGALVAATDAANLVRSDVYDRDPLPRWRRGVVTLLGDAAHPAAPTLGQGACQAIEDAVVLGACLAQADDVDTALDRYEAKRLRRANGFLREARRLGRIGLWRNPLLCGLRDRMIAATPAFVHRRELARMFAFEI